MLSNIKKFALLFIIDSLYLVFAVMQDEVTVEKGYAVQECDATTVQSQYFSQAQK